MSSNSSCDFNLHFLMTSELENFSYVCWPLGYTLENDLFKSFCSVPKYQVSLDLLGLVLKVLLVISARGLCLF